MRDPMVVNPELAVPLSEIELRTSRSSGPGGQHANVTASRVDRLRGRYGDRVTAVAQDARSQARNRELALERLRDKLAAGVAIRKRRRPTRPSKAAGERRLEAKRRRSERKRARRPPAVDE
jgi:ribosome-associated protein